MVDGPNGAAEVDARPSDALALALVVGAPVRADREVLDAIEASPEVAAAFAAIDSQDAPGPQALVDELAGQVQREDPPEPPRS